MRHFLLAVLAALLALPAFAQTRTAEVVSDTFYLTRIDSVFFETRTVRYANGRETTDRTPLGDSVVVSQYYSNATAQTARSVASASVYAARRASMVREFTQANGQVTAVLGAKFSTARALAQAFGPNFTGGQWNILNIGAPPARAITFTLTAANVLRYSIAGGSQKNADVFGDTWIRLREYPSAGTATDFFFDPERNAFISLGADGKPGAILAKSR